MIYTFPRAREYFEPDELALTTGVGRERFKEAILKELVDNALDEAEKMNEPIIEITDGPFLTVQDNGPGADVKDLLDKVLDFSVRASSKLAWKRPTRGYLGNALKTIFGMAHVLAPEKPVVLESRGLRATVTVRPLSSGEIRVNPVLEAVPVKPGFSVTVPVSVSCLIHDTFIATVLFNPHVTFQIKDVFLPKVGDVEKYPANAPVSPDWFDAESLFNLMVMVAGQEDLTVREFISRHFTGLSGAKAGRAAKRCPVKRIRDLVFLEEREGRKAAVSACADLLWAMGELSRPVPPAKLGGVGRENITARAKQVGIDIEGRYVRKEGFAGNKPFVLEVYYAPAVERKYIFTGLNFSGTYKRLFDDNFLGTSANWGLRGYLKDLLKSRYDAGFFLTVHVVMPGVEYTSKDKKPLLPREVVNAAEEAIARAVNSVKRTQAKSESETGETTLKEAVFAVLPEAADYTSGGGEFIYSSRTLFYQVRDRIQRFTDKELNYSPYFTPALLTEYQEIYGPLPGLYYDPRGVAVEPFTGQEIPLGTREVADYTPPDYLYNKVLYVEKKGILPTLKAAELDKKYDLCICAGEGYASRAAKDFLAMAEKQDIVVLCLHDFDINGLEIARTLQEGTRTSKNKVKVIDLGLRYKDVVEMGLAKDPEGVPLKRGWRKPVLDTLPYDEYEFLVGDEKRGNRVELNALTPGQLIEFIEKKLAEHGLTKKVIPPDEVIMEEVKKQFDLLLRITVEKRILEMLEIPAIVEKVAQSVKTPDFRGLPEDIAYALEDNPPVSWRDLVKGEAREFVQAALEGIDLRGFLKNDPVR